MSNPAPVITRLKLEPGQSAFFHADSKYVAAVTGIGGGKSLCGCAKAIARYQATPGSLNLIAAPTYPNLRDTTQRTFFELLPAHWIAKWNRNEGHLVLKNGAEVLFRALVKYDFLRGLNLASAYVDEAALIDPGAWRVIKGRLRQKGFIPQAWVTSTPRGKNWLWQEFAHDAAVTHTLVHWSGRENRHLPPGFYDELGYTGNFAAQEIDGDFVAFEGLVYRVDPAMHVKVMANRQWSECIGGIDWGYTNPAVALPIGLDGDRRAHVLDEVYQRHMPTDDFITEVVRLTQIYHVTRWYAGPDEPEHIDKLNAALSYANLSCRCVGADNRITIGIQTVSSLLAVQGDGRPRLTIDPACVNMLKELDSYQYATKEDSQRNSDEKPLKQNDHAADALRYALHSHLATTRGIPLADEPLPGASQPVPTMHEIMQQDPFEYAARLGLFDD